MKTCLILVALIGFIAAAPAPKPAPTCTNCRYGKGFSSSYYSSYPSYAPSASYYETAPAVVHETVEAPVYHETVSTPVVHETVSAPVYHETVSTPVVHETVAAPVYHETVSTPVVHRQPHVISTYTTQTVGVPEYIPVKTTIQKTSHTKYHVKVPYEYNYEIERPVTHTTSYIDYKPAVRDHVVSVPSTSYYAPSSSYYAPSASYYAPSTSYSTSYVAPSTSIVSEPVANSLYSYGSPSSSYYNKDYTSANSYEHFSENYGSHSW